MNPESLGGTVLKTSGGQVISVPIESFFNAFGGESSNIFGGGSSMLSSLAGLASSGGSGSSGLSNLLSSAMVGGSGLSHFTMSRSAMGAHKKHKEENRDVYHLYYVALNVTECLLDKIKDEFKPLIIKIGLVNKLNSLSEFFKNISPDPFDDLDSQEEQDALDRETISISNPKLSKKVVAIRLLTYIDEIVQEGGFLTDNHDSEELKKLKEIYAKAEEYSLQEILEQISHYQFSVYDLVSSKILDKIDVKIEKSKRPTMETPHSKSDEMTDNSQNNSQNSTKNLDFSSASLLSNKSETALSPDFEVKPLLIKTLIKCLEASEKIPVYPFTGLDSDGKPVMSVEKLENLRYHLKINLRKDKNDTNEELKKYERLIKVEPMVLGKQLKSEIYDMVEKMWFEYPREKLAILKRNQGENTFIHSRDFDNNGLLYYLGTNGKTVKSWANPIKKKIIFATTSNGHSLPYGEIADFAEHHTPKNTHTVNQENGWIAFDLGVEFQLTAYSLRHSRGYQKSALRNWQLQGSNDCIEWAQLRDHKNDNSLSNVAGSTKTWKLKHKNCVSSSYRYLRLQSTGVNSSTSSHQISISGIEFYGRITNSEILEWPGILETKIHPETLAKIKEERKKDKEKALSSSSMMEDLRRGVMGHSDAANFSSKLSTSKMNERDRSLIERYESLRSRLPTSFLTNDEFDDDEDEFEDVDDEEDEYENLGKLNAETKDGEENNLEHDDEEEYHSDFEDVEKVLENREIPTSVLKKFFPPAKPETSSIDDVQSGTTGSFGNLAKLDPIAVPIAENSSKLDIAAEKDSVSTKESGVIAETSSKESKKVSEKAKSTSDISIITKAENLQNSDLQENDNLFVAKSSNQLSSIPENNAGNKTNKNMVLSLPEIENFDNSQQNISHHQNHNAVSENLDLESHFSNSTTESVSNVQKTSQNQSNAISAPCLSKAGLTLHHQDQQTDKNNTNGQSPIKRSSNTSDIPSEIIDNQSNKPSKTSHNFSNVGASTQSLPMMPSKNQRPMHHSKKGNNSSGNNNNNDPSTNSSSSHTPTQIHAHSINLDRDQMDISESIENAVSDVTTSKSEMVSNMGSNLKSASKTDIMKKIDQENDLDTMEDIITDKDKDKENSNVVGENNTQENSQDEDDWVSDDDDEEETQNEDEEDEDKTQDGEEEEDDEDDNMDEEEEDDLDLEDDYFLGLKFMTFEKKK